ncbi:uncharacterized protein LOC132059688 isoform X2 [Lycium ferocissimum]|uniref:uncharacterized protein LOC132059688 isoform X2 n=1 Tax=Lycium ferocissimum TaxID=112874 RepID=UPI002815F55C|nr:uncharacterized protein LOC132059688 isoform X2 [Lycium ferocissimum]
MRTKSIVAAGFFVLLLILTASHGFQSDELVVDDEEFGLEGGIRSQSRSSNPNNVKPSSVQSTRKRSVPDSDSKIQFTLEHAFGDSDFSPAGTFTARLKSSSHGSQTQTLTKLRFSRNAFTGTEKEDFKKLLKSDDFYRIRVPSNVLNLPGREYVVSSVKADGVNILAVNYGSPGACQYPRQLKFDPKYRPYWVECLPLWVINRRREDHIRPYKEITYPFFIRSDVGFFNRYHPIQEPAKWSFNSHTVLKPTEQAPRQVTVIFYFPYFFDIVSSFCIKQVTSGNKST